VGLALGHSGLNWIDPRLLALSGDLRQMALVVILLYIVPSIAPLAEELGSEPPMALSLMLSASNFLSANLALIGLAIAGGVGAILVAGRAGLLSAPLDRLLLGGPRLDEGRAFQSLSGGQHTVGHVRDTGQDLSRLARALALLGAGLGLEAGPDIVVFSV
jgi:hypothetical protein